MEPLFLRLDAGMDYSLTLVLGPAGAGKTALLRHWLAARNWPAAWVALDAADNDQVHFVQHLVVATQHLMPDPPPPAEQPSPAAVDRSLRASHSTECCSEQDSFLAATEAISKGDSISGDALAAWLNILSEMEQDLVLVLDGYERIEATAIHDALRLMLDYPPPGLHLYIASRAEPPLPLPRLRVRRQLLEVKLA